MKLTQKEIKKILDNWEVDKLISYIKAEKGVVNHNWVIKTTKGKYILRKLHGDYKIKDIEFELSYLMFFEKNKFPYKLPLPILTKQNKKFIKNKLGIFWLYEFIEGDLNEKSGRKELSELALMVATYHNFLEKSKIKNAKSKPLDFRRKNILKEIKEYLNKISKIKNNGEKVFVEESKKLIPIFENLDTKYYNSLKKYPVHRDLNPENLIWKGNKLIGIIDFENVGLTNESLIGDLAIIMQYYCSDKQRILDIAKAKLFLREYRKFKKLSKKEIELLPEIITAICIEDFVYAYWMIINDPTRAKVYRLKKYSCAAQWYWNNKGKILGKLR